MNDPLRHQDFRLQRCGNELLSGHFRWDVPPQCHRAHVPSFLVVLPPGNRPPIQQQRKRLGWCPDDHRSMFAHLNTHWIFPFPDQLMVRGLVEHKSHISPPLFREEEYSQRFQPCILPRPAKGSCLNLCPTPKGEFDSQRCQETPV